MPALPNISPELIKAYQDEVSKTSSQATTKRKNISLNRFFDWATKEGYLKKNPLTQEASVTSTPTTIKPVRKNLKALAISGMTFGMALLIFAFAWKSQFPINFITNFAKNGIPEAGIQTTKDGQISSLPTSLPQSQIPANTAVIAGWNLFAKLRLVGTDGLTFKLYDSESGGQKLWEGTPQNVSTDSEGDSLIAIGGVPNNLFFENQKLFLAVEQSGSEASDRIPVSTANTPVIGGDGNLVLAGESPAIKASNGDFLIEGQTVTIKTTDGGDGNIEINPDGQGIAHFLFEGTGENYLNAQAPNLTKGSLYYGIVANNATGYDLLRLQNGSTPVTRFSVDATGATFIDGKLTVDNSLNITGGGGLQIGGITRLTSAGRLTSITGYYQDSGTFEIDQGAPDYADITKLLSNSTGAASSNVLTLTLDESSVTTGSDYDTLVLNRLGGTSDALALFVDNGNVRFDGQVQVGNFTSNPIAIGDGSIIFNTTDDSLYFYNGTSWVAMGAASTVPFSGILSGTNTSAAMVVGTGASLTYSGSGTINASTLNSIADTSFLRSDTSDSFTSGTLTTDAGTTLDVNGDISIADTNIAFDGATTTFTTTGDLTLNIGGGDLILNDTQTINIGGSGSDVAFNAIGDSTAGATNVDSDDDLYIEGNLEVDGTIYGTVSGSAGSVAWDDITSPTDNLTLTMAAYNTTFNWDPGPDSAETNFSLTTQGEDSTGGGDEDQVLLALSQTDNGVDVDEAADALLTFANNDPNDPVNSAIRFDAGGAGVDFTYGINFDAASIGTAELVLQNAETIDNTVDGTVTVTSPTTSLSGVLTVNGTSGNAIDITNTGITTDIVLQNDETIDNNTDGTITLTAPTTSLTGNLNVAGTTGLTFTGVGGDITFTNGEKIDNDTNNQINLTLGTAGTLLLTSATSSTIANTAGDNTFDIVGDIILDADGGDIFFKDAGTTIATFTNSTTDLTVDIAGGNLFLADGDTINVGGLTGALTYNSFANAGEAPEEAAISSDNDVYIGGDLEVDGTIYGTVSGSAGSVAWDDITSPTDNLTLTMAAYNTTFNWDPGPDSAETAFSLTIQGEDTIGVDESQILLSLSQTDNGVDVTEAADALLYLTNADPNDPVGAGILFGTGSFTNYIDTPSSVFKVDGSGNITGVDLTLTGGNINTGDIPLVIGDATTDSITLTTDGTGNAEIVLPNDSIGPNEVWTTGQTDEYCLTYEGTGTTWEWQTCGGSSSWSALTNPTGDLTLTMAAWNSTFNWDPGPDSAETNFSLTTQGEDSTGGGDEDQVLLALSQTDNGVDVDEAADALLTFANNDPNDPVNSAIRFDAGGAGVDFTYGINFDAADIGTAEIVLENAEQIHNQTDGTITLEDGAGTDYATFTSALTTIGGDLVVTGGNIDSVGAPLVLNATANDEVRIGDADTPNAATGDGDLFVSSDVEIGSGRLYLANGDMGGTSGGLRFRNAADTDWDGAIYLTNGNILMIEGGEGTNPISFRNGTGVTSMMMSSTGDLTIGVTALDDDDYLYFDSAAEWLNWSESSASFFLSDDLIPTTNDSFDLGSNTLRWNELFLGPTALHVGTSTTDEGTVAYNTTDNILNVTSTGTITLNSTTYVRVGDTGTPITAADDDDDLYVEGDVEIVGNLYLTGNSIYNVISGAGTGTILLSTNPTGPGAAGDENKLTYGVWLIENATNDGMAALMVNQTKGGAIFSASASGVNRFNIANNGTTTITTTNAATTASLIVTDASGVGAGKIDVGTVDPPYTINGKKYATFMAGMIGVKEEVSGQVNTSEYVPGLGYRFVIDFNNQPEGSDLWLFGKTTNIKENINQLVALLTPSDPTRTWYEIDSGNKRLAIYSARPTTISFRLTGPRFDYEKWANTRDNDSDITGFILNDIDNINLNPVVTTIRDFSDYVVENVNDGYYVLKDSSGQVIDGLETIGNVIAANIKTGRAEIDNLIAANIKTNLISPIPGDDLTVSLGADSRLEIQNQEDLSVVASIDNQGNATFAGDATVSGTLYAGNVQSQNLDEMQALLTRVEADQTLLKEAATWSTQTATEFEAVNAAQLTTIDLFVTGTAAMDSLSLSQSLTVGTDMILQSSVDSEGLTTNSIDTLSAPLKIQSLALAPVEIMAGLIRIETNGDVKLTGNLYVAGEITTEKGLKVQDSASIDPLASIDALGSATFKQLTTDSLIVAGPDEAQSGEVINGEIQANSTVGSAHVPAGASEITIVNPKVNDYTMIYVTPTSPTENNVLYLKSKQSGQFVVGFTDPISTDVTFNWWIVQVGQ